MNPETRGILAGKTVLVTGGASGLGAAVVQAVVEAGGNAIVLDLAVANGAARVPVAVGARAGEAGAGEAGDGVRDDGVQRAAVGEPGLSGAFESRTAAFALDVSDGQAVAEVIAAAAEVSRSTASQCTLSIFSSSAIDTSR